MRIRTAHEDPQVLPPGGSRFSPLLAGAVLAPVASAVAGADMMGPQHASTSAGDTWGDSWCGGGMWGGSGSWGGTGMWGTGSGMAWLTNNPDALAAWLQLRTDHHAGAADLVRHLQGRPHERRGPAGPARPLDRRFWNDMKAFYETVRRNGATWTCPDDGMWGGWGRAA